MKKNALIIYLFVVITFLLLIPIQIVDGGLGIAGGVVAGIGFASCVTSLLPFFVSRYLFTKAEPYTHYRRRYQIAAISVYIFCFPVKLWAIYMAIYLLYHGEPRWAFG
ncbi:hypothetical protein [uncultured Fluviicola sp.]|uniref:hypothetical protein n=1 Tax=uncultured Fluviicola sp. TaxID=463303 RepID=UPI0025EF6AA4|nr:hypothetical protein [uncultured Fluviicola sp.]